MSTTLPKYRQSGINLVSLWLNRFSKIGFSLITIPLITRHFGLELMGVWLLITQTMNHLQLLELGINTSLGRFIAKYRALEDRAGIALYYSSSLVCLIVLGLIVLCIGPFLASYFHVFFRFDLKYKNDVFWTVLLACISVGIGLPLRSGIGLLSAAHRFERLAIWESLSLAIRLILIVIGFYFFDIGLITLEIINFGINILQNVALFTDGIRLTPGVVIQKKVLNPSVLRDVLSVGLSALVITFSAVIIRQGGPMSVGYFMGAKFVALLAFPMMMVTSVSPFLNVANRLISPVASQHEALNNKAGLLRIYMVVSRYSVAVSFLILVAIYMFGKNLLRLWLGDSAISPAEIGLMYHCLIIVFAGFCLSLSALIGRSILVAVGRHWQAAKGEVLCSVTGIIIGLVLMNMTELGVMGMAIGIASAFIIRGVGFLSVFNARYLGISYGQVVFGNMVRPLAVTSICAIVLFFVPDNTYEALLAFGLIIVIWAVANWLLVVDSEHKANLVRYISNLVS